MPNKGLLNGWQKTADYSLYVVLSTGTSSKPFSWVVGATAICVFKGQGDRRPSTAG